MSPTKVKSKASNADWATIQEFGSSKDPSKLYRLERLVAPLLETHKTFPFRGAHYRCTCLGFVFKTRKTGEPCRHLQYMIEHPEILNAPAPTPVPHATTAPTMVDPFGAKVRTAANATLGPMLVAAESPAWQAFMMQLRLIVSGFGAAGGNVFAKAAPSVAVQVATGEAFSATKSRRIILED